MCISEIRLHQIARLNSYVFVAVIDNLTKSNRRKEIGDTGHPGGESTAAET